MERNPLAQAGAERVEAANANLPSLATWQRPAPTETPTTATAYDQCKVLGNQAGHSRQPREENCGSRWGGFPNTRTTAGTRFPTESHRQRQAGPSGLDTRSGKIRKTSPRDTNDDGAMEIGAGMKPTNPHLGPAPEQAATPPLRELRGSSSTLPTITPRTAIPWRASLPSGTASKLRRHGATTGW
jgi:hypothetical protein